MDLGDKNEPITSCHLVTSSAKREGSPSNPSFPHSLTFSLSSFPLPFLSSLIQAFLCLLSFFHDAASFCAISFVADLITFFFICYCVLFPFFYMFLIYLCFFFSSCFVCATIPPTTPPPPSRRHCPYGSL